MRDGLHSGFQIGKKAALQVIFPLGHRFPFVGKQGRLCLKRDGRVSKASHTCTRWVLHSHSVDFATVQLHKSRISVQMGAAASAYLVMAASEK